MTHSKVVRRLEALEAAQQATTDDRVFLCYLDQERHLIDGVAVDAEEWGRRSALAGSTSYVIEVSYTEGEQLETELKTYRAGDRGAFDRA